MLVCLGKGKRPFIFSAKAYWPTEESATLCTHASMLEDAVNATKNNETVSCK